nr:glycosyltransferase family 4 protein [uncultured Pseudomonas sp.]
MKLLILSFYYHPDLSAGSFRTSALVKALLEQLPADAQIELITTLPNRYSSFTNDAPQYEAHPRLIVHRIALPAHQSGMIDQSKAFLSYGRGVLKLIKGKRYDLVYATSSRLMTAALGSLVARRLRAPLYLDIRDIFVDTIKDVLPRKVTLFLKPVFSLLESWTIRSADKVNLVSAGFLPYFKSRYPRQQFSLFTNGIDDEFIQAQPEAEVASDQGVLDVVYAGNMGEGQGLQAIIPALAKRFEGRLRFRLIGDGGRRKQLADSLAAVGCNNVELLAPVNRDTLIDEYKAADVLFLHLNDHDAFRKVLPSKLFEYAALGKPIWAGVAGYASEFVNTHISNAVTFSPCCAEEAVKSFEQLELRTVARIDFVEQFSRVNIMNDMACDVMASAGRT